MRYKKKKREKKNRKHKIEHKSWKHNCQKQLSDSIVKSEKLEGKMRLLEK